VGPYFDAAEMYVLPGTGGLGINEAMAHRLPIVSGFADGSADDLVVDGENGFRLREGTPKELAQKIAAMIDNTELANRMGEKSREWITGKFAFREFVSRVEGAITMLLENK
jgi:glycosyltransferase involved in cell wall biosynthesis